MNNISACPLWRSSPKLLSPKSSSTAVEYSGKPAGLYNRRGFLTFAKQHMKLARRIKQELLLVYLDLDGLKQINDNFGHQEGDWATGP